MEVLPIEFIHIPQTGGEAVENAYPEYRWGSLRHPPFDISKRSPWHNDILLKTLMKKKICFAIIRDPVERLLEVYKFWQFPDNPLILNQTIEKWAETLKIHPFYLDNNLRPQSEFLCMCKHIVLYDEFLEENLNKVLVQYGIPKRILAPENPKTRYYRINKASLSSTNLNWIQEYYKQDYETLQQIMDHDGILNV